MSTNNRWHKLAVKSETHKTILKSQVGVSDQFGNEVSDFAVQQGTGRGRPRSEDKGQVVSCRLPAEKLHAVNALCTQLGAKSRSDGVRSVVTMVAKALSQVIAERWRQGVSLFRKVVESQNGAHHG